MPLAQLLRDEIHVTDVPLPVRPARSRLRRSRDLGFSIGTVRELLKLADQKEADCGVVDVIAREHLAEIERKIADLMAMRGELLGLIGQCGNGTITECRLVEALSPV